MAEGSSFRCAKSAGARKAVAEYGDVRRNLQGCELPSDAGATPTNGGTAIRELKASVEISYEYLPKTRQDGNSWMRVRRRRGRFQAALAAGDKLTDVYASGMDTPDVCAAPMAIRRITKSSKQEAT